MNQINLGNKLFIIIFVAVGLAALLWFVSGLLNAAPAMQKGLVGLTFVAMVYAILLISPPKKFESKTFWQNIQYKLPVALVVGSLLWFVAGFLGFPIWWQIEFVSFACVALAVFVILDLQPLQEEKNRNQSALRLLGTFCFASLLFISLTALLPQFDKEFEVKKLNKPPIYLITMLGPDINVVGREVFENNNCFDCHKIFWEGNSDIGPNLGTMQIGLYTKDYIKEQILNPRKNQSRGFHDPESRMAMPTNYGDNLTDDELYALVAYLKTMRDPTNIPVEGKLGDQWTWWDDPKMIEEGKVIFENPLPGVEGFSCSLCHGIDGAPKFKGMLDFRNGNSRDTDNIPGDHSDKLMKDWPDSLWYKRVTRGVPGTPMAPWGIIVPHIYLWKSMAYARTFHDPLDKRTEKRPVPPIPTKEEIESWKTKELFLDPLL